MKQGWKLIKKIYLHSLLMHDNFKVITVQVIAQRDSCRTLISCMESQYGANVRDKCQTMTDFIPKNIRSQFLHLKNSLISESYRPIPVKPGSNMSGFIVSDLF